LLRRDGGGVQRPIDVIDVDRVGMAIEQRADRGIDLHRDRSPDCPCVR